MKIRTPRATVGVLFFALAMVHIAAQAQPVTNSSLYYRLGGGDPAARANNKGQTAQRLGLNVSLRLNYSCGKFDIGLSWGNVMNGISNLGQQVTNAVKAGIAALPMYALQRAQPGLYQIFQTYSQKADALIGASLKTCEEMEAMIKSGQDPYEDYVKMAKGESWRGKAQLSGDIVQAKYDINKNEEAQKAGVSWVFGAKAGGAGNLPIQPIRDLSVAGYNSTLNKATTAAASTNYGTSTDRSSRLVQAFKTPEELATFTTEVLGDKKVTLCTQSSECPTETNVNTATGLGPKYEAEIQMVQPRLVAMANASQPNYGDLREIAAPGMALSPTVMDALRKMPTEARAMAVGRLAQELSMHRVVDKALVARNVLVTGLSLPEVTAAGDVAKDVQTKIDRLTQYINDMMFEFRIRKEMTSATALAILEDQGVRDTSSSRVRDGRVEDPSPLVNGRVAQ